MYTKDYHLKLFNVLKSKFTEQEAELTVNSLDQMMNDKVDIKTQHLIKEKTLFMEMKELYRYILYAFLGSIITIMMTVWFFLDVQISPLKEHIDKIDIKIEKLETKIEKLETKIEKLEEKMDERFQKMDERFQKMDERFQKMDEKIDRKFDQLLFLLQKNK